MYRMEKLIETVTQNPSNASIADLERVIEFADKMYYTNISTLTDDMYDSLKEKLALLSPNNNLLLTVGAKPIHNKINLPFYMGSMNKIKEDTSAISKFLYKNQGPYVVSDKLDGVSAIYIVKHGIPSLYTRGDGRTGQDITDTLLHFLTFPKVDHEYIAVRGELIMSKIDFETLSADTRMSNARNVVSGVVNAKKPNATFAHRITFIAYALFSPKLDTIEQFVFMKKMGFNVVHHRVESTFNFKTLSIILADRKQKSVYEIDGIIVGGASYIENTSGNPSNAFAFKSPIGQDFAIVVVKNVEWNVSKDGMFKPVLIFDAVNLSGVMIQKCTAFNADFVVSNTIGIGSKIKIIRAGEVIPHCIDVLTPSNNGQPLMPSCDYIWNDTHKDILITDADSQNPSIQLKLLQHFVEKMSIDGMGAGVTKKLFDANMDDPYKIMHVTVDQLLEIPTFRKTSASNLIHAIERSRDIAGRDCMIYMIATNAFGRGFGERKLKSIVEHIPYVGDHGNKQVPTILDLVKIDGISDKSANAFIDGLARWRMMMHKFKLSCSVKKIDQYKEVHNTSSSLSIFIGKNIVFTGIRDKDLEKRLELVGATIQSQINKKTDFLIAKDISNGGVKVTKAKENGICILSIEDVN